MSYRHLLEPALADRRRWMNMLAEQLENGCASPIELQMGIALLGSDMAAIAFTTIQTELPSQTHGFYILPQHQVGSYRLDFGVCIYDEIGLVRVAVECDGHDFHERTKQQAAHDKSRDRFLLEQGWPVMRFTGSEIHKNAPACANQVVKFLYGLMSAKREQGAVG